MIKIKYDPDILSGKKTFVNAEALDFALKIGDRAIAVDRNTDEEYNCWVYDIDFKRNLYYLKLYLPPAGDKGSDDSVS